MLQTKQQVPLSTEVVKDVCGLLVRSKGGRMWNMTYVNNVHFHPRRFWPSYFSLFLLQAQLDQKKTNTDWTAKNRYKTVSKICDKNDWLRREILLRMKLVKTALNARVVIFGKAQTDEDGIIQCAIAVSKFSLWDKLLH